MLLDRKQILYASVYEQKINLNIILAIKFPQHYFCWFERIKAVKRRAISLARRQD